MNKKSILITTLILLIFLLAGLLYWQYQKTREAEGLTKAIADELEVRRNDKGQEEARIAVIVASNERALMKLETKDTIISWLKETIKDYRGDLKTAIVLGNQTETKGATSTQIIRDTITETKEGEVIIKEIKEYYKTRWSNDWEEGWIDARPDSIRREIKIKNKYEITLGETKNGWFKPKEYEVQILNLNPNTITKELRSFQVRPKPKRLSLGVQIGYGVGLLDFKPQPYVGLGLQFNLIGVK